MKKHIERQIAVILALLIAVSGLLAENVLALENRQEYYETTVQSGPYTGMQRAYLIYSQNGTANIRIQDGAVKECYFKNNIYYTLNPEEIGPGIDIPDERIPKVSGDFAVLKGTGKKLLQSMPYACFQPGDIVAVVAGSNAKASYSVTIYSEREGRWEKVASDTAFAEDYDSSEAAVVEYTVSPEDKKLKAVSKYTVAAEGESVLEDELYFLVAVGSTKGILTTAKLRNIALPVVIFFVLAIICAMIIRKRQRSEDI